MNSPRSFAVYCASADGSRPGFLSDARRIGEEIASRSHTLVYGGGSRGLMGAVANGALSRGGRLEGVITRQLVDKEVAHPEAHEMLVVETMHERKALMAARADAFVVLPGGLGTLDELFEVFTWAQLGLHQKPIGLLNTDGFFDTLLAFLDRAASDGFLRLNHRAYLSLDNDASRLISTLHARL